MSGVSDHDMIMYDFHVKAEKIINRTGKVYLYHKADLLGLKNILQSAYSNFRVHASSMTVETQWVYFKSKVFEAVDNFVPSCHGSLTKFVVKFPKENVSIKRQRDQDLLLTLKHSNAKTEELST